MKNTIQTEMKTYVREMVQKIGCFTLCEITGSWGRYKYQISGVRDLEIVGRFIRGEVEGGRMFLKWRGSRGYIDALICHEYGTEKGNTRFNTRSLQWDVEEVVLSSLGVLQFMGEHFQTEDMHQLVTASFDKQEKFSSRKGQDVSKETIRGVMTKLTSHGYMKKTVRFGAVGKRSVYSSIHCECSLCSPSRILPQIQVVHVD